MTNPAGLAKEISQYFYRQTKRLYFNHFNVYEGHPINSGKIVGYVILSTRTSSDIRIKGRIIDVLIHSYIRLSWAKSPSVSSRCEEPLRQMFVVIENSFFIINY